jgi:putative transposon-encoded protein
MTYVINPTVTIADVDYSSEVLNGIRATAGRTNVDEQPRAGFATVSIVDFDSNVAPIEIDDQVVIKVDDSSGNDVTLWTGWVSDVEKIVRDFGNSGAATETRVTAIGTLAKLNRRRVGASGYPKQFDGDRVAAIIYETAGETWAQVTPTLQWQNVNPLQNWATYDILIGDIEQPGDFELTNYNDGETNGLFLAQTMASSGLGILYESPDGKINYDSFSDRLDKVILNGFTSVDLDAVIAQGLSSLSRLSDLGNNIEIVYKNGQQEFGTDSNSLALYGEFDVRLETQLENKADAEQRVEYYLETRAFPRTSLTQLTLVLGVDAVDDGLRDTFLPIQISEPITISGLPPNVYPGTFNGFVEGYTWAIARNELFLSLNVSDYALSQLAVNWLQVTPSLAWNTISPTLQWADARSVS